MKVAVFSTKSYDKEFFDQFNDSKHTFTYFEATLNKNTTNLTVGFNAVCIFVNDKIDQKTIVKLAENGVKLIVLRCAGFNNIDLNAASENNIKVYRVPAYSPNAIAEHALALILTLNRKTHKAYNRVRENNFSLANLIGFNLNEKTIGVIGTGKIGIVFCTILKGFGCKILAYDLEENAELKKAGVVYKTIDQIFKQSDIISLHCPLTPETKHLINKEAFSKMKDGVIVINTSRGAVVDTKEAIRALKSGRLGYLGIDVYEQEEHLFFKDLSESIIQDDVIARLISFPNVLITAHQGFFTKEALEEIVSITIQNINDFENNIETTRELKVS